MSGGLECMEVEVGFVEWGRVVGTNREECIAVLQM